MKVKSPLTFRRASGDVVLQGDPVDASEVKRFKTVVKPEPYETKVVREVADDAPRATEEAKPKPRKKATKKKAD